MATLSQNIHETLQKWPKTGQPWPRPPKSAYRNTRAHTVSGNSRSNFRTSPNQHILPRAVTRHPSNPRLFHEPERQSEPFVGVCGVHYNNLKLCIKSRILARSFTTAELHQTKLQQTCTDRTYSGALQTANEEAWCNDDVATRCLVQKIQCFAS